MSAAIEVVEQEAVPYVGTSVEVSMRGFSEVIDATFPALFAWLAERDVVPSAAPFIRYERFGHGDRMGIEFGVPIDDATAAGLSGDDMVQIGRLPAGRYATLVHVGSYDGLMASTDTVLAWGRERGAGWDMATAPGGIETWTARYESYVTDPRTTPVAQLRTEICMRLVSLQPVTTQDLRYGEGPPTPWATTRKALADAELYWLSSVRPDGRVHSTPLMGVWFEGALWFCSGPAERKTLNLAAHAPCTMSTGQNRMHEGLDVVVEGTAQRCTDEPTLEAVADLYRAKYDWHYTVHNGGFDGAGGPDDGVLGVVHRVTPSTVFAFAKEPYSQTRHRF